MSSNMRGGWKVNATEYNRQKSMEEVYRTSHGFKAKNNSHIYFVVLAIVLCAIFA